MFLLALMTQAHLINTYIKYAYDTFLLVDLHQNLIKLKYTERRLHSPPLLESAFEGAFTV